MNHIFFKSFGLAVLLGMSISCSNPNSSKEETSQNQIDFSDAIQIEVNKVDGIPESTLTFNFDGAQHIITEPTECQLIKSEDFASSDMPLSADAACRCWWAGAGADYMLRQTPDGITLWKRLTDESPETVNSAWLMLEAFGQSYKRSNEIEVKKIGSD